jgi:hypothetical protein
MWSFRIFRALKEDSSYIEQARLVIAGSEKLLRTPIPDTFAGRKTYEPFPGEDDEPPITGWLNSRELQPPK